MSRDIAPFGVRMPTELKEQLQFMAIENKRSVNAEVVAAIESAVEVHNRNKLAKTKAIQMQDATGHLTHEELINKIVELLSANGI